MFWQQWLRVETRGRGTYALTPQVADIVATRTVDHGLCNVFLRHTSASLLLTENADPDVRRDLETFMTRLVPDGADWFQHTTEGPDDMAAHVRNMLAGPSVVIPIASGRLALGTWQGIYLWEHRTGPQVREVVVTLSGE